MQSNAGGATEVGSVPQKKAIFVSCRTKIPKYVAKISKYHSIRAACWNTKIPRQNTASCVSSFTGPGSTCGQGEYLHPKMERDTIRDSIMPVYSTVDTLDISAYFSSHNCILYIVHLFILFNTYLYTLPCTSLK